MLLCDSGRQVLALMWMRTTINFQHKYGRTTSEALRELYAQGGISRFYQGLAAALLQAPLSRFGDTASYAGMMALLEALQQQFPLPPSARLMCASLSAATFRIAITPIDTLKTTLQVVLVPCTKQVAAPHSMPVPSMCPTVQGVAACVSRS